MSLTDYPICFNTNVLNGGIPFLSVFYYSFQADKERVIKGEEFEVTVRMENPLEIPLTECEMSLEGPGTQKAMNVPIK